jgi:hypothetical protein
MSVDERFSFIFFGEVSMVFVVFVVILCEHRVNIKVGMGQL